MIMSSSHSVTLALGVALLVCLARGDNGVGASIAGSSERVKDQSNELEQVANNPRSALTRFLFYNSRPTERTATGNQANFGYKRSSSALDALTGVTLGKRAAPMELVNLEPIFGRQYDARSGPRMYDLRWAPLDSYEGDAASPVDA